jgi:hypothetical protein
MRLTILGAVIALLRLIGFAIPVFSTTQTRDVAKLGDLELRAKEQTTHVIPPLLSEGTIALGVVLLGAGLYLRK